MSLHWSEDEYAAFQRQHGPAPAPVVSERTFMQAIIRLAKQQGYMIFHVYDSRRSPEGFMDLVLVHPTARERPALFWELKTATGQVTPAQAAWVDALDGRTTVSRVVRPADLEEIRRWVC